MQLYPTKDDLPEGVRSKSVVLLGSRLATALTCSPQTKQTH